MIADYEVRGWHWHHLLAAHRCEAADCWTSLLLDSSTDCLERSADCHAGSGRVLAVTGDLAKRNARQAAVAARRS